MPSVGKIIIKNFLLQRRSISGYVATNTVYRRSKLKVISGIFKGITYVENSTGGAYFPKLLGTYEKELYPSIEKLKNIPIRHIINAGSGEGFFSVGLARIFTAAHVVSFDPSFYGCFLHERLARLNAVEKRITIRAEYCTPKILDETLSDGKDTLIFMDVEGAEWQLLNPAEIPGLKNSIIMVEIHDTVSPELSKDIIERFKDTHRLSVIHQQPRTLSDLPFKSFKTKLFPKAFSELMNEGRGTIMRWFFLVPNAITV